MDLVVMSVVLSLGLISMEVLRPEVNDVDAEAAGVLNKRVH